MLVSNELRHMESICLFPPLGVKQECQGRKGMHAAERPWKLSPTSKVEPHIAEKGKWYTRNGKDRHATGGIDLEEKGRLTQHFRMGMRY